MSSCSGDAGGRESREEPEDFAGDIPFEATDDLGLAHPFRSAALHVGPSSRVVAQSHDDDPIEGGVGPTVASAIKPMSIGFS